MNLWILISVWLYLQLVIPHVTEQNSGVYVCTATNNYGLAYRQAQLSVYGKYNDHPMKYNVNEMFIFYIYEYLCINYANYSKLCEWYE